MKLWLPPVLVVGSFAAFVVLLRADPPAFMVDANKWFIEYPEVGTAPALEVQGAVNGRDVFLQITTDNFSFSENCAAVASATMGHAHIYIDGVKHKSVYQAGTVLKNLEPGKRKISVSLNVLPDHKFITHNGVPIQSSIWIEIANDSANG